MKRPPDSRSSAGEQREQMLDGITYGMRRDTATWLHRMTRGHPNDGEVMAAAIGGIAGGLLDKLWAVSSGDPDQIRNGWEAFVDGYLAAIVEDQAGDDETAGKDQTSE